MENRYILAFYEYLDAWLSQRSMPETLKRLSSDATGFGTGFDENAFGVSAISPSPYTDADLYVRDLQNAPDPVRYEIRNLAVTEVSENVAVVMAVLDLSTMILEQWVQFHGLRISLVLTDAGRGDQNPARSFVLSHHRAWKRRSLSVEGTRRTHAGLRACSEGTHADPAGSVHGIGHRRQYGQGDGHRVQTKA